MSVEIERPIGEVFDYTTQKVAEWSSIVVDDVVVEDKGGVGTTFRTVTEDRGCRMDFDGVITKYEPPTAHTVAMKGKQFDMNVEYIFEDLSGCTRVTQRSNVNAKGMLKVFFFFFGWMMTRSGCKAVEKELMNLKRLMEEN